MSPRMWAAAPLAGAVIALAAPTAADAATVTVAARPAVGATGDSLRHDTAATPFRAHDRRQPLGGGFFPHCPFRNLVIGEDLRAILTNCRRGPRAVIKSIKTNEILTYLDVNFPVNSTRSFQLRIVGFYRRHPALLVQNFGRRPRWFYFLPSRYHYR
ncbi:hypothetical protein [Streptantibioticus ferralitis]|uniref:Uncharacterized protein n=1 Tax=Streptantibioticus ferralitis TaxID=236510 RepID=A0ABT5YYY6_9ACTN|nr:hypothetical protein [Streptantibioticus ferralitis]MDF2256659.1 hypothetical protein [Streptantibioticus ferralitis]